MLSIVLSNSTIDSTIEWHYRQYCRIVLSIVLSNTAVDSTIEQYCCQYYKIVRSIVLSNSTIESAIGQYCQWYHRIGLSIVLSAAAEALPLWLQLRLLTPSVATARTINRDTACCKIVRRDFFLLLSWVLQAIISSQASTKPPSFCPKIMIIGALLAETSPI